MSHWPSVTVSTPPQTYAALLGYSTLYYPVKSDMHSSVNFSAISWPACSQLRRRNKKKICRQYSSVLGASKVTKALLFTMLGEVIGRAIR